MSKELEALEYIKKNFLSYEIPVGSPNCVKELDLIETALKRLEEIDKVMFLNNQKMEKQDEILTILKEHIVFEDNVLKANFQWLIKDKKVQDLLTKWLK